MMSKDTPPLGCYWLQCILCTLCLYKHVPKQKVHEVAMSVRTLHPASIPIIICYSNTRTHTHVYTRARARTHTHTHTHLPTPTHTYPLPHSHTRNAHTHAQMYIPQRERLVDTTLDSVSFSPRASLSRCFSQEAAKFTRHSKRQRLNPQDVNAALRLRNLEPLYGYESCGTDANRGSNKEFKKCPGSSNVFYVPDDVNVVDLSQFIKTPLPKCPADVTLTSHWLAVEGVQPRITENPTIVTVEESAANAAAGAAGGSSAAGGGGGTAANTAATAAQAAAQGQGGSAALSAKKKVEVKGLVKHELSREQQLYYRSVTEGMLGTNAAYQKRALESLSKDPGLHQLLPYFAQFVAEKITIKLGDLNALTTLVKFTEALLQNPSLYPEPYLHPIMAPLLTCVVNKSVSKDSGHWKLRDLAASVVCTICTKYGQHGSPSIQTRITKTMIGALLDTTKSLAAHYGAIVTLGGLGTNVIDALLIDSVKPYTPFLQAKMADADQQIREDARHVHDALLAVVGKYLRWQKQESALSKTSPLPPANAKERYDALRDLFGSELDPFTM